MQSRTPREIALGAVAVLAVAAAAYTVRSMASAPDASNQPSRSASVATAASTQAPKRNPTEVDLSALTAPKVEPAETVRNPFRFKPKPPPPPPPRPTTLPATTQPGGTGGTPEAPPPPPRIQLKFIGVFEVPGKGTVANLSDGRGVYRGAVGDTIEGRYRIVQIGVESIELAYLDGRGRQTIRLTGQ
jgi:hypothetical protein